MFNTFSLVTSSESETRNALGRYAKWSERGKQKMKNLDNLATWHGRKLNVNGWMLVTKKPSRDLWISTHRKLFVDGSSQRNVFCYIFAIREQARMWWFLQIMVTNIVIDFKNIQVLAGMSITVKTLTERKDNSRIINDYFRSPENQLRVKDVCDVSVFFWVPAQPWVPPVLRRWQTRADMN